jgi:hypothetical protein
MKQFVLNLNLSVKKTRKKMFLAQMEQAVPSAAWVELIAPQYPKGRTGRPPLLLATMLRIHFLQQWFALSMPRSFQHRAPPRIKTMHAAPQMHSRKKGNPWRFGMKAHLGVDADSGLVYSVRGTPGHVSDIAEGNTLLHGQETVAFGDAGYQGVDQRPGAKTGVPRHVAMRPGKPKALGEENDADVPIDQAKKSRRAFGPGWASVSGDQTPVWIGEGSLSRAGEKHGTARHVVCTLQSVDGAQKIDVTGA